MKNFDLTTFEGIKEAALTEIECEKGEGKGTDFCKAFSKLKEDDYREYCSTHNMSRLLFKLGLLNSEKDKVDKTVQRYMTTFNQAMRYYSNGIYDSRRPLTEKQEKEKFKRDNIIISKVRDMQEREMKLHYNIREYLIKAYNQVCKKKDKEVFRKIVDNFTIEKGMTYYLTGDQTQLCHDLGFASDRFKSKIRKFLEELYRVSGTFYNFYRTEEVAKMYPEIRNIK